MRFGYIIVVLFEMAVGPLTFVLAPRNVAAADTALTTAQDLQVLVENSALPEQYRQAAQNYLRKPVQQIIGGVAALPGELPWQVSLGVALVPDPRWAHFCGGVLYRDSWVITAAHCVNGIQPGDVKIAAGVLQLSQGIPRYSVDQILVKPGYAKGAFDNDVALIHLTAPLPSSASIRPIDIVSDAAEKTFVNRVTEFTASGWGASMPVGLTVSALLKVNLPYASPEECSKPLSYPPDSQTGKALITDQMICAGRQDGGVAACQGDSGGPLVFYISGVAQLVGVDSWAGGCGLPYKYNVYSRLNAYRPWLEGYAGTPPAQH
jgi:secreted trypsin-like serine protease